MYLVTVRISSSFRPNVDDEVPVRTADWHYGCAFVVKLWKFGSQSKWKFCVQSRSSTGVVIRDSAFLWADEFPICRPFPFDLVCVKTDNRLLRAQVTQLEWWPAYQDSPVTTLSSRNGCSSVESAISTPTTGAAAFSQVEVFCVENGCQSERHPTNEGSVQCIYNAKTDMLCFDGTKHSKLNFITDAKEYWLISKLLLI